MWFYLALLSAIFLGIYDIFKKVSLNKNAVLPVLMISIASAALIFLPLLVLSTFGIIPNNNLLYIPEITASEHLQVFLKAIIVLTSWIFSFFALKHLPITLVAPIRATGPFWTLLGAILIFSEQLNTFQWIGIAITLLFFYLFTTVGKLEGIHIKRNKWFWFIILATLSGAVSGLYDKHLLQNINRLAVQSWFSIYQTLIMLPIIMFLWYPKRKRSTPFIFRWTIPLIGISLVSADYIYFKALSEPEALISVISAIRRGGVIIAFSIGAILFKEQNIQRKTIYLLGIILGIGLLIFGSAH
ncbi:DMT family transporter [Carboxylicivirga mesophila]|uniref:DMT family transporter n=1 Tax=Carboxylicivirga mesophila TaxID=1166478 RepID=A0ABS5KD57_9BACT|nr:EamA family transporter [Carboxylicivirga mesophila]MBS2212438.1 DMT family transporter [Carboxylicivirga mesophila]